MKAKQVVRAIGNSMMTFLMIALVVTLFSVLIMKASGGQASIFGYQVKTVLSGSMEPLFQTGSIITIKETDTDHTFKKDDVITFTTGENIVVTHRIIDVKEADQLYITKGDANDAPDMEAVSPAQIIGAYTGFTIPYIGYILHAANTNEGAALILVIPGICFLLYSIFTIRNALQSINQKEATKPL